VFNKLSKSKIKVASRSVEVTVLREAELILSIVVNKTKVPGGESVMVGGRLKLDTLPVSGQEVLIFQDKEKVATAITDENGNYSLKIEVPTTPGAYEYRAEANIDEETITKMGYVLRKEA
jgi:hypothetical protein